MFSTKRSREMPWQDYITFWRLLLLSKKSWRPSVLDLMRWCRATRSTRVWKPRVWQCGFPVVGVLRSSCQFATCLCDRFALIAPTDSYIPYVWRLVESYRMGKFVSEIRALKFSEHDIPRQRALAVERIVALSREMIAAGAQAIVPLGGNVVPYQISPEELEPQIGAPVINTKAVGIRFAELMVLSHVTHSQRAYPWSPGLTPDAVVKRS